MDMITLDELLRDPEYRAYFAKPPKLPAHYTPDVLPWRLFVMKQGETKWRSKRFGTYREAFEGFKKMRPVITNAAINCPGLGFMPPIKTFKVKGRVHTTGKQKGKPVLRSRIWVPQIEASMPAHNWCPHCRRPSIFITAALGPRKTETYTLPTSETALRCSICGASERVIDLRNPENAQKWDLNRPKVY